MHSPNEDKKLLTADQLAAALQIPREIIFEMLEQRKIKAYRIEKFLRFDLEAVLEDIRLSGNEASDITYEQCGKECEIQDEKKRYDYKLQQDEAVLSENDDKKKADGLTEDVFKFLIASPLMKNISVDEICYMAEAVGYERLSCSEGEIISKAGDIIDRIMLIAEGSILMDLTIDSDSEHQARMYRENQTAGLEVAMSRMKKNYAKLVSEGNSTIISFNRDDILNYFKEHTDVYLKFLKNVIELLCDESIRRMNHVRILSARDVRTRIMTYLRQERLKSDETPFPVRDNRIAMANHLGITRQTLSNELKRMKAEGIIDYEKGRFSIIEKADG